MTPRTRIHRLAAGAALALILGVPAAIVAQGGLKPILRPEQFRPKIEPKLPPLDPSRAVVDPFARRTSPIYPDRLKSVAPLTPGDSVELAIPDTVDLAQVRLQIESVATSEVWELPIESIRRVLKAPSKYIAQNVRVPVALGRTGFTVPQLPKGRYRAYYVQGQTLGPKTELAIEPKLVISGRRVHALDNEFTLGVSLAGPAQSPATVRVRSSGGRLPSGAQVGVGGLLNVRMPPSTVRLNVSATNWGNLAIQSNNTVRMDESGRANFEFVGRVAGSTPVSFSAPNQAVGSRSVRILARAAPPVIEEPNRRLRLLVFGDSLAWGQGLKPPNKYSGRVGSWMQAQTSRVTDVLTYAHSGGTLRELDNVNGDRRLPGEVPVWFPAVPRQIEYATTDLSGRTVDLVLLNGAINDVPVFDIINPFADTKETVAQVTTGLEGTMKSVLVELGRTFEFRKSLIVYTGYFPLITSNSNLELMASSLFVFFSLIPSLEAQVAGFVAAAALEVILIARHGALNEQSATFYTKVTETIQKAVQSANAELGTDGGARVLFVDPSFSNQNAFCAPNTLLWTFGVEDEVAGQRLTEGAPYAIDAPVYPVASLCHPNLQGAQRYADRIIAAIGTDARRAIWDGTRARRTMRVESVNSTFTIPAGQAFRDFTFSVQARDASTGAPIRGDVYIGGAFAGKTAASITRRFRRPTATTPLPEIVVSRPGYADGALQYTIR